MEELSLGGDLFDTIGTHLLITGLHPGVLDPSPHLLVINFSHLTEFFGHIGDGLGY